MAFLVKELKILAILLKPAYFFSLTTLGFLDFENNLILDNPKDSIIRTKLEIKHKFVLKPNQSQIQRENQKLPRPKINDLTIALK